MIDTNITLQSGAVIPQDNNDDLNFYLNFKSGFREWLREHRLCLLLTTYETSKLIAISPGANENTIITGRYFDRCMALYVQDRNNIWVSTESVIWHLENGLYNKEEFYQEEWDRIYLPRRAYFTGNIDVHDMVVASDNKFYAAITAYNCVGRISAEEPGCFSPYWKPPFISAIVPEDRCHLNGLCLHEGHLKFASIVARSDKAKTWRTMLRDGGLIMDMRNDEIIAQNLCMPHTPKIYDGALWFTEGGRGYLCRLDLKSGQLERVLWRPGFLRGLKFYKNFLFLCSSAPRESTFSGLPLEEELSKYGQKPRCAVDIVDMDSMEVVHSVEITGVVKELFDVGYIDDCKQPLILGPSRQDTKNIIVTGPDETSFGALGSR